MTQYYQGGQDWNGQNVEHSIRPFPIRPYQQASGLIIPQSWIPWWLAEIAYARWCIYNPTIRVPLEKLAEQGGFGAMNFLDLMSGGAGRTPFDAFRRMIATRSTSVKDKLPIIVSGTPEFYDAMKQIESEAQEAARAPTQHFFASGPLGLIDKKR